MSETIMSSVIERVGDRATGRLLPLKVAEMLDLPLDGLARLVGMDPVSFVRDPWNSEVQERLGEVVRIVARAASLMADPEGLDAAVRWFRSRPIAAFRGRTAQEMVQIGRSGAVLEHLEMLADGVFA